MKSELSASLPQPKAIAAAPKAPENAQVAQWVQNPGGSQHTWQGPDPLNGGRSVNGQAVGTGAVNVYGDPNNFKSGSGLYPKLLKPGM